MIKKSNRLTLFEMCLFAMFAAMMFMSKIMLEFLPNVHLLGMFTVLLTSLYRKKALIPIYIFVLIEGVYVGFALWWVPYLYIWTVLWGFAMLVPKDCDKKYMIIVYPLICSLHGFLYGTLYAPFQMLAFSLSFRQTLIWIAAGLPWDAVHGISNFFVGFLIYPLRKLLKNQTNKLA